MRSRPLFVPALCLGLLAPALASAEDLPALTLGVEDAVAATLASQPRLRSAQAEARASAARATQAAWQHVGTLETTSLYTPAQRPLQVDFPGMPNLVPATSFEVKQLRTYAFNATLVQPLWTWGAVASSRSAAQGEHAAVLQNLARLRQQLVLEASQAFFVAATAAAAIGVAEQNLEQQRSFLRATESRLAAGTAAKLDVLKAELAVSEAESALLAARNRHALAREALATVTMDARFRSASLREADGGTVELPAEADALARALAQRPDLAALRRQGDALGLREKAIRAASLPSLALRASLTQQHDDLSKVLGKGGQIYELGLALRWDATEPARSRSRVVEVAAGREALAQGVISLEEGIRLEVRSALQSASEALAQVRVAQGALATAEEQARVARLAYREGATSALEARDAELGLTNARFTLLRARLDVLLAREQLRFAVADERDSSRAVP